MIDIGHGRRHSTPANVSWSMTTERQPDHLLYNMAIRRPSTQAEDCRSTDDARPEALVTMVIVRGKQGTQLDRSQWPVWTAPAERASCHTTRAALSDEPAIAGRIRGGRGFANEDTWILLGGVNGCASCFCANERMRRNDDTHE